MIPAAAQIGRRRRPSYIPRDLRFFSHPEAKRPLDRQPVEEPGGGVACDGCRQARKRR